MKLSHFAVATIEQLKRGGVWDGDLVSKTGRDECVRHGLAQRVRKFASGPYRGCEINELTADGKKLAASMIFETHTRN